MPDKVQSPFSTKYISGLPSPVTAVHLSDLRHCLWIPLSLLSHLSHINLLVTNSEHSVLYKLFLLSHRLSISYWPLSELLVILQNPTQNHFLLEAFPEHPISTPTEFPAPVSEPALSHST